jgi:lipopolysaccharide assembly outer membrane protein LptD (OstA)
MNYKIVIQLLLLSLVVFLIFYFYKDYLSQQNKNIFNEPSNNPDIKDIQNNVVKDIVYKKIYNSTSDEFVIKASYGEFIDEKNEIIILTNVNALVNRSDGSSIYIYSDKAKYNTINNDTNFIDNIELIYLDNKINSDFLDVIFSQNLIQAYGNLVYQNVDYKLFADKMELDIDTKNTKIFMFDNSKVKIKKN